MNTKLKDIVQVGELVSSGNRDSLLRYIDFLTGRIRDLDSQLRKIHDCCEKSKQENLFGRF